METNISKKPYTFAIIITTFTRTDYFIAPQRYHNGNIFFMNACGPETLISLMWTN